MPSYRRLAWDSDFLGVAVARIAQEIDEEESVTRALAELKADGVRLAYWQPRDSEALRNFARASGASFVGTHVRFERSIEGLNVSSGTRFRVQSCSSASEELEALAVQAGTLSRFALDPAMPPGTAERLYTIWMRESFGGAMGDEVLAAHDASGVAGMVTLKHDAIGLVAVAERCRGAGLGRLLVQAATTRAAELGKSRVSVVTQGENTAACRLYESCGYALAERSLIVHFWIT
jgi:dTDP-4-amino-4,6-dideoxy-D-galactose acyltransferase